MDRGGAVTLRVTAQSLPFMGETMRNANRSSRSRLQFDFSPEACERLDELVNVLDASSRAEVVRRALRLLAVAVEAERAGARVSVESPDGDVQRLVIV